MKRVLLVLCSGFLLATQAAAQAPAGNGWISLFNGKDLSGWKNNGQEKWVAEDGAILGESTVGHYGYLTTEKTYSDFVLRLKFKCETDGNSGVFTRSRITGDSPDTGPDIEGMQVEVDPTRHTGGIYESGGRGWVALPPPAGEKAIKAREWNDLEIAVEGRHYVTRLNGVQCADFQDPAPRFTNGVIGLQLHTGGGVKIRFKDIYLMPLSVNPTLAGLK
jgi:hypothetical protein